MLHTSVNAMARREQTEQTQDASFLAVLCTISDQVYGLPVVAVREVVDLPALLPIAGAAPYLSGLLNLRGLFIPVLDGRVLLHAPAPRDLRCQVIILGSAAPEYGLIVDQARTVQSVRAAAAATPPRKAGVPLLSAVLETDAHPALLLDVLALRSLVPAVEPAL